MQVLYRAWNHPLPFRRYLYLLWAQNKTIQLEDCGEERVKLNNYLQPEWVKKWNRGISFRCRACGTGVPVDISFWCRAWGTDVPVVI